MPGDHWIAVALAALIEGAPVMMRDHQMVDPAALQGRVQRHARQVRDVVIDEFVLFGDPPCAAALVCNGRLLHRSYSRKG